MSALDSAHLSKLGLKLCDFSLVYHLSVRHNGHEVESDLSFTVSEEGNNTVLISVEGCTDQKITVVKYYIQISNISSIYRECTIFAS